MSGRNTKNQGGDQSIQGPEFSTDGWDAELLQDFPEDDPAADTAAEDPCATTETATDVLSNVAAIPVGTASRTMKRLRFQGTGVLCFALVMLAGLTLGSGLITAIGAPPETLWDFTGFHDPLTIGDFHQHPVNAFWLASLVTLVAAVLAAVAVERRLTQLGKQTEADTRLLDALYSLDPERAETWQHEAIQADADFSATTGDLLGHYNLQQAKLKRYVGLEGELHRLEKAMADECIDDLAANWESPAAGSLADQAVRMLEERTTTTRAAAERMAGVDDHGADLVAGLRDARSWNSSTLDQLNLQGAALERVARQLAKSSGKPGHDEQLEHRRERMRHALDAMRQELAAALPSSGPMAASGADLDAVAERASRLAFQIAMEVARLGSKGDRLLPLTQDLEELTTELRQSTGQSRQANDPDPREVLLGSLRGRMADVDPAILDSAADKDREKALQDAAPVAYQTAESLVKLSQKFNLQTERLDQVMHLATTITGIEPDGIGDPSAAPGAGLLVDRHDPFATGSHPEAGLVADPFASSGDSIFDADGHNSGEFAQTALPGQEELSNTGGAATGFDSNSLVLDADPGTAAPADSNVSLEPSIDPLPLESEKVYDLTEFDIQRLPRDVGATTAAEQVFDLSEFGAVRIG